MTTTAAFISTILFDSCPRSPRIRSTTRLNWIRTFVSVRGFFFFPDARIRFFLRLSKLFHSEGLSYYIIFISERYRQLLGREEQ